jgi:hypothetical protein
MAASFIVVSVIWANPARSALGAVLLATGVPAYYIWNKRRSSRTS